MIKYRGYTIESLGNQYLVHTGGMYGYYWFKTVQEAKIRIDTWL